MCKSDHSRRYGIFKELCQINVHNFFSIQNKVARDFFVISVKKLRADTTSHPATLIHYFFHRQLFSCSEGLEAGSWFQAEEEPYHLHS